MTTTDTITVSAAPSAGIIWAYRFRADGTAEVIPGNKVEQALADGDGWIWIHLGLADSRCRTWVQNHAPVSEIVREILLDPDEHPQLDLFGRDIVGVIPDLQLEFDHPTEELGRLRFALGEKLFISIRRTPLRSIEVTRRSIDAGTLFHAPIDLLDAIIDHFADFVAKLVERLGEDLDTVEDHLWLNEYSDERERIGKARNQAARVHRQLSQLRTLFNRLEARVGTHRAELTQPVRALTQKLEAFDHSIGSIYERARLLQEEMSAKMTAITNRRLFTLSMLTAGLLPPTLVTGFFGMNTKDLPFQNVEGGTWYALAIAAAAGALTYWLVQRLRAL